jgi:hypothetical protein
MKLYNEKQVKELLETQRGNCYVAVLNEVKDMDIAGLAVKAPLPGGDDFDKYFGIDPESLFKEDLEDRELQENFDGFKRHLESAKTSYNACVPTLNSMISKIVNLKELIVSLSVQGLPTEKAVKRMVKLDNSFTKLSEKADLYKEEMAKQEVLIDRYERLNERKFFNHWKYLTLLKVTDVPWMDWMKQYKDVMI